MTPMAWYRTLERTNLTVCSRRIEPAHPSHSTSNGSCATSRWMPKWWLWPKIDGLALWRAGYWCESQSDDVVWLIRPWRAILLIQSPHESQDVRVRSAFKGQNFGLFSKCRPLHPLIMPSHCQVPEFSSTFLASRLRISILGGRSTLSCLHDEYLTSDGWGWGAGGWSRACIIPKRALNTGIS